MKRILILTMLISIFSIEGAMAQVKDIIKNVPYEKNPHELQHMDIYLPQNPNGAAAFLIHGGGWTAGNREQWTQLAEYLSTRGYVCASTSYRLAPDYKYPAQRDDVRNALVFFSGLSEKYGFDNSRIGAVGSSAGGHLAALLGTLKETDGFHRPQALALYNPVVDFVSVLNIKDSMLKLFGAERDSLPEIYEQASPARNLDNHYPPTIFLYGSKDTLTPVETGKPMMDSLKKMGITADLLILEGMEHGFGYKLVNEQQKKAAKAVGDFLDKKLLNR